MSEHVAYKLVPNMNRLMKAYRLSATKIGIAISRPTSTITRITNRDDLTILPTRSVLADIAKFFNVTVDDLLHRDLTPEDVYIDFNTIEAKKHSEKETVPLYTADECLRVSRGEKVDARESVTKPSVRQRPLNAPMFAYYVLGNGYSPKICHGDITFCYKYDPKMALREDTVLLVAITPTEYSDPVLTFGKLHFGGFGEKNITYPFEEKERTQKVEDDEILGVVAINCVEFV